MARGDPHHVIAFLFCLPLEVNIRLIHSNPPLSPFSIMHVSSLATTSVCGAFTLSAIDTRFISLLDTTVLCWHADAWLCPPPRRDSAGSFLHHSNMQNSELKDFNYKLSVCATHFCCWGFSSQDWGDKYRSVVVYNSYGWVSTIRGSVSAYLRSFVTDNNCQYQKKIQLMSSKAVGQKMVALRRDTTVNYHLTSCFRQTECCPHKHGCSHHKNVTSRQTA